MAANSTPVLLVTANVGSIFEDPEVMLKIWTAEFLSQIARLEPKFIALHCQEVGGKNYEQSMKHVDHFVNLLLSSEQLRLFDKVRVYLDEDYSSAEKFTALGSFYFVHKSLTDVLIWDFKEATFVPVADKEVHSGSIEDVATKEKSKFPQDFFPECKWSRKGFLRTRWNLSGTVFDLINIHLFHDASNFVAMESAPSEYCKNRRRALEHLLERFHSDGLDCTPFFLFGDFNFRTETHEVVKKLSEGLIAVPTFKYNNADECTKMHYQNEESEVVLSLGKKEFCHVDHQNIFLDKNGEWLRVFDKELEPFNKDLFEFNISFPPSYPFEEDERGARCYMQTRCPAWCDRVLMSHSARQLIQEPSESGKALEYYLMGQNTCMGDHKPVYLKMWVLPEQAGEVFCKRRPPSSMSSSPCCPEVGGRPLVRAQSGGVERPAHALANAKCRCLSEPAWQSSPSRHRLISSDTVRRQLSRFSSHHSSSDEDWFEVVDPNIGGEEVFLPADTKTLDERPPSPKIRPNKCCTLL
ncbi:inositol polyphosphate-5-phosphatase A isoform X1 [Neocloeon triangulifer]|uniref:inositol polyphosphate-5-phosphatase A isoform X1 n=1 Tax=Neocloeon triangulifer TaxID=2078957 RepID=UPI00286EFE6B|nr:inositol polyphosphate-5-phosphatase A isoform X1 [Neocloeon triangulifer]